MKNACSKKRGGISAGIREFFASYYLYTYFGEFCKFTFWQSAREDFGWFLTPLPRPDCYPLIRKGGGEVDVEWMETGLHQLGTCDARLGFKFKVQWVQGTSRGRWGLGVYVRVAELVLSGLIGFGEGAC